MNKKAEGNAYDNVCFMPFGWASAHTDYTIPNHTPASLNCEIMIEAFVKSVIAAT